MAAPSTSASSAPYLGSSSPASSLEKQFEDFRIKLDESSSVRERIRAVVMEMEAAVRLMNFRFLLVHHSLPNPEVLEKAMAQIEVLKGLFGRLAEILRGCPGENYRYHGDWRSEAQAAVSLKAFLHWLDTGSLLMHAEAEKILGCGYYPFGAYVHGFHGLVEQKTSSHYSLYPARTSLFHVDASEFGLDIEDYLVGICFMSNKLEQQLLMEYLPF